MQFLYAQYISNDHPVIVEFNLLHNIEQIFNLYKYRLSLLLGLQNSKIIFNLNKNKLLTFLSLNRDLREYICKKTYEKDLLSFFKKLTKSSIYREYCSIKNKSFKDDKNFILSYYAQFFTVSKKLSDNVEDNDLTYMNDLYIAHVMVYKTIKFIHPTTFNNFKIYDLHKDIKSKNFVKSLFRKTLLYKEEFNRLFRKASTNWKIERISIIDLIILQMSICEFLYFSTIPPLVYNK